MYLLGMKDEWVALGEDNGGEDTVEPERSRVDDGGVDMIARYVFRETQLRGMRK